MYPSLPDVIMSGRGAAAFRKLFWGYIFFLDIRVGMNGMEIDLIPDFVGWLLFSSAFGMILDLGPPVRSLRNLAHWLVFLSLFDLVHFKQRVAQRGNVTISVSPFCLADLIYSVLDIILTWKLCGLIMDLAWELGDHTIWERANFRRKLYVAFEVCATVAVVVLLREPSIFPTLFCLGAPVAIIIFLLMMGLMLGAESMCSRARPVGRGAFGKPPLSP